MVWEVACCGQDYWVEHWMLLWFLILAGLPSFTKDPAFCVFFGSGWWLRLDRHFALKLCHSKGLFFSWMCFGNNYIQDGLKTLACCFWEKKFKTRLSSNFVFSLFFGVLAMGAFQRLFLCSSLLKAQFFVKMRHTHMQRRVDMMKLPSMGTLSGHHSANSSKFRQKYQPF